MHWLLLLSAFQSTPPGWEATIMNSFLRSLDTISIHASRVGGDALFVQFRLRYFYFNPRLPGGRRPQPRDSPDKWIHFNPRLPGGRRLELGDCVYELVEFQSTPPGWEATDSGTIPYLLHPNFNPRLPGGRRLAPTYQPVHNAINFNPRLPGGRRHK